MWFARSYDMFTRAKYINIIFYKGISLSDVNIKIRSMIVKYNIAKKQQHEYKHALAIKHNVCWSNFNFKIQNSDLNKPKNHNSDLTTARR